MGNVKLHQPRESASSANPPVRLTRAKLVESSSFSPLPEVLCGSKINRRGSTSSFRLDEAPVISRSYLQTFVIARARGTVELAREELLRADTLCQAKVPHGNNSRSRIGMSMLKGKPPRKRNTGWVTLEDGSHVRVILLDGMRKDGSWTNQDASWLAKRETDPSFSGQKLSRWREEVRMSTAQLQQGNGRMRALVERSGSDPTPMFVAELELRDDGRLHLVDRWNSGFIPRLLEGWGVGGPGNQSK